MSSERLQPGMWCRPSSEREWRAILELADALGVSQTSPPRMKYEEHPCVWADVNRNAAQATDPDSLCLFWNLTLADKVSIPVPEFISRMYAEAEARKAPDPAPLFVNNMTVPLNPKEGYMMIAEDGTTFVFEGGSWVFKKAPENECNPALQKQLEDLAKQVMDLYGKGGSQLVGTKQLRMGGPEMRKAIKDFLRPTNKQRFDALTSRLEALEAALDTHLRKHREAGL